MGNWENGCLLENRKGLGAYTPVFMARTGTGNEIAPSAPHASEILNTFNICSAFEFDTFTLLLMYNFVLNTQKKPLQG